MGGLRIGLQRARYRADLPVLEFWRAGLGLKRGLSEDVVVAPYATALAAMIDPEAAAQNFIRLTEAGASGRMAFMRRSITRPRGSRRPTRGRRARLYGASPGDVARGARERPLRGRHARALSRRAAHASHRAAVAGTHSARRPGRPAQGRRGARGRQRPRSRSTSPSSLHFTTRFDSRYPPPFQRAIRRDGHDGGLRIQPLARPCGYTMARTARARCLGNVRFLRDRHSGRSGRPDTNRAGSNRTAMKWLFPRIT